MRANDDAVLDRARRAIRERVAPAVWRERVPLAVEAWAAPGEPVPFAQARAQAYRACSPGTAWGPAWGTTWFHVSGVTPLAWRRDADRPELLVDLGFTAAAPGFQAEGLVFEPSGRIVKGVEPRNTAVPLTQAPGQAVEFYIEAASNPDLAQGGAFTPTPLGDRDTAGSAPLYRFGGIDLALRDLAVWELLQDLTVLERLAGVLPDDRPRRARLLDAVARALDVLDPRAVSATAGAARAVLAPVLASPAHPSAHTVVAVGHAHIDSAWLWPVRETIRKCARTFSNVLSLMDECPDFQFVCSSAQQYAWVKQCYPVLFERMRDQVREGRFIPVGGMWVESDTNMPGGEAMVRQFLTGHEFFAQEFGVECPEVWLPDSFGYSAALPQIAVRAGARWFLTQKLSWNDTNTMPHHTFAWEGIDGSRILCHFPPVDTYNSDLSPADLDRAERRFSDQAAATVSLVPFGYGDGGGGPTREMVAAGRRAADLEGLPRVRFASAREFFETAEAENPRPPVWSGEMYLELHRGCLTSQARTKRGNRRSEALLREAELWAATAAVRLGEPYPYAELREAWRTVLLNQFHDILPGSSIAWVHRQAERAYAEVAEALERLIGRALARLAGPGGQALRANAGPCPVDGVPALGAAVAAAPAGRDRRPGGEPAVTPRPGRQASGAVLIDEADEGSGHTLDNGVLRLRVDPSGVITSLVELASGREVVPSGTKCAELLLHRDTPNQWDAWDVDAHYRRVATPLVGVCRLERAGATAQLLVEYGTEDSRVVERIRLRPGAAVVEFDFDIDWHERQKLLKLAFPVAVQADRFASETQFGHVMRPTHSNTSWDVARFEVCAHRWVHVAEPGFGVGLANDSSYGHDVFRDVSSTGEPHTVMRVSLLRAPLYPDPEADQGAHAMAYSLAVGAAVPQIVAEGYRLNLPPRRVEGGAAIPPLLTVAGPGAVVEAVKLAQDGSGDVIVRLYEALGGRCAVSVTTSFEWESAAATDLLEREDPAVALRRAPPTRVETTLRPFQILTLRFAGVAVTAGDGGGPGRSGRP
jgi:alpha-mannosidase